MLNQFGPLCFVVVVFHSLFVFLLFIYDLSEVNYVLVEIWKSERVLYLAYSSDITGNPHTLDNVERVERYNRLYMIHYENMSV